MLGCLRSLVGKLVLLVLLVGAAVAGWRLGPQIAARVRGWLGLGPPAVRVEHTPGPELADSALARYRRFSEVEPPARLALDAAELESLLRYAVATGLPEGVRDPRIALEDGRATVSARVPLEYFLRLPDLNELLAFLPDTVPVRIEASLIPLPGPRVGVLVEGIEAARVPLPRRFVPEILSQLGRRDEADLPANALAITLPRGVGAAYIVRDTLYLVAGR